MQKEQILNALDKLKRLNKSFEKEDAQNKKNNSAWEFTFAQPKPPLNTDPHYGSGIRPKMHKGK